MPEAQLLDSILGEEFLTWLWFASDTSPDSFCDQEGTPFNVCMEQRIVVQGGTGPEKETAVVSGSLSPLREAKFGLGSGKKVTRALIRVEKDELAFQFTLRAEDFCLAAMKTPKIDREDKDDDLDAMILEKIFLLETCLSLLDTLYSRFLKLRVSERWQDEVFRIEEWFSRVD